MHMTNPQVIHRRYIPPLLFQRSLQLSAVTHVLLYLQVSKSSYMLK